MEDFEDDPTMRRVVRMDDPEENVETKKKKKEPKKRIVAERWQFNVEQLSHEEQMQMVQFLLHEHTKTEMTPHVRTLSQEIHRKIQGYKQQDKLKKKYNANNFLTFDSVLNKMLECSLKCRYCEKVMDILYDITREMTQWSVDRIDNERGHDIDNYHLACLECNLNRRRRTDEKYLFTKQLKIVKIDTSK